MPCAACRFVLRSRREPFGEAADLVVDEDRVPGERSVSGSLDDDEVAAGEFGEPLAILQPADVVVGSVEHRHRLCHQGTEGLDVGAHRTVAPKSPGRGVDQGLRRDLVSPRDSVLDLLCRVRLAEHLREEEPHEVVVVAIEPVVLVVLVPPVGVRQGLVPGHVVAGGVIDGEAAGRGDGEDPEHALGPARRHVHRPAGTARKRNEDSLIDACRIHHGNGVGGILLVRVCRGARRATGGATSATVEGDDPEVTREVAHLRLPDPRRHDRPRRHEQQRRRPGPEGLPGEVHPVAGRDSGLVGAAGPAGRVRRVTDASAGQ